MADANHVRACITLAFFVIVNIEVSKSVGFRNIGPSQEGNCRWIEKENYGIDLTPLENYTTETRFIAYADKRVVYFYHPCSDVPLQTKIKTVCTDAYSLCFFKANTSSQTKLDINSVLRSEVAGEFHKLALAKNAVFQPAGSEVHIVFNTGSSSSIINLLCNSAKGAETTLLVDGSTDKIDVNNHNLTLSSPYSCSRSLSHEKHHMSGWAVFFIILVTVAAAYFFGGMLVLRHIKGATGTEMIPNYDFWVSLPGKIKEGDCHFKAGRIKTIICENGEAEIPITLVLILTGLMPGCLFLRLIGRGSQGPDSYERI